MAGRVVADYPGDDETHRFLAPSSASGTYHITAFKDKDSEAKIRKEETQVGVYRFVPGQQYTKFGSEKKKSAGYIRYEGVPLTFVGTYQAHGHEDISALFVWEEDPMVIDEFPLCYYSWKIIGVEGKRFFLSFTHMSAARVMEMDQ